MRKAVRDFHGLCATFFRMWLRIAMEHSPAQCHAHETRNGNVESENLINMEIHCINFVLHFFQILLS
jgi:hypothetical protein